jgi:hypothetical protein
MKHYSIGIIWVLVLVCEKPWISPRVWREVEDLLSCDAGVAGGVQLSIMASCKASQV